MARDEGSGGIHPEVGEGARRPTAPLRGVPGAFSTRRLMPVRYELKETEDGRRLTCVEAPNLSVRMERDLSVSASAARKHAGHTIFLDGVAQGPPFMDTDRSIYNLDHHEGCVRAFTLATCEQTMVLIRKGLDLSAEPWEVWGNDPDLDTVLAVWLLLNHRRLDDVEDDWVRSRMMPIVRLQGVIDAHGLELQELTGFPADLQRRTLEIIEGLREREVAIKELGEWSEIDLLEYTLETLQMVDELVYSPEDFEGLHTVDELARVPIGSDRFAIMGRSDVGIYELEEHLRAVHGDRIGLIMLEKEPGRFTVRQVDPFLRRGLEALYERLNFLDPKVSGENRWGGSSDIGGSPRSSGSGLDVVSLARIIRWVYRPPGIGRKVAALVAAVVVALIVPATVIGPLGIMTATPRGFLTAALVLVVVAAVLLAIGESRFRGHFGLRRPSGWGWLGWLPVAGLAAVLGGGWLAHWLVDGPQAIIAMVLTAAAVELLFRGVCFGVLATSFRVNDHSRGLAPSVPNLLSALLSTGMMLTVLTPPIWMVGRANILVVVAVWVTAGVLLALVCGMARARWHSLWAAVGLHVGAVMLAWLVLPLVAG